MASDPMTTTQISEFRIHFVAYIHHPRTASAEVAAFGRVGWTGHISLQDNALAFLLDDRVGNRYGAQQGLSVRMQGIVVDLVPIRQLGQLAQIHHRDAITDVPHHTQVVGDKEVRQAKLAL
jgi:hypothetical protein